MSLVDGERLGEIAEVEFVDIVVELANWGQGSPGKADIEIVRAVFTWM
jgi:hypothetical protein